MLHEGAWGVARTVLLASCATAIVGGCAGRMPADPSAPLAAPPSASLATVPAVPATAGSSPPGLPSSATAAALVGLSAAELTGLIGAPRWTRREAPAQVWQYQGARCVLDVYLYEDGLPGNGAGPRVVYAEARGESALPVTIAACLKRMEAERRPSSPAS